MRLMLSTRDVLASLVATAAVPAVILLACCQGEVQQPDSVPHSVLYTFVNLEADSDSFSLDSSGQERFHPQTLGHMVTLSKGAVVVGKGKERGDRIIEWANVALAGRNFAWYSYRNDPVMVKIYAFNADAFVLVALNGNAEQQNNLKKGQVWSVSGDWMGKVIRITSTGGKIVVTQEANGADYFQVPPAAARVYGTCSQHCWISFATFSPGTQVLERCSDRNETTIYEPDGHGLVALGKGEVNYTGKACSWASSKADSLLNGVSYADMDGGDGTSFLPSEFFQAEVVIPLKVEWLKIISNSSATCSMQIPGLKGAKAFPLSGIGHVFEATEVGVLAGQVVQCSAHFMAVGNHVDERGNLQDEYQMIAVPISKEPADAATKVRLRNAQHGKTAVEEHQRDHTKSTDTQETRKLAELISEMACADGSEEHKFAAHVVGCDGAWTTPGIVNGAALCGYGWEICQGKAALKQHGITAADCDCPPGMSGETFYATLQSGAGSWQCSANGADDVWGCGCHGPNKGKTCGMMNYALGNKNWKAWQGDKHWVSELNDFHKNVGNGGVMCCKKKAVASSAMRRAQASGDRVVVTIGKSSSKKRCVTRSDVNCPSNAGDKGVRVNPDYKNANDKFVISTLPESICAERQDSTNWGMNLQIACTKRKPAPSPSPSPAVSTAAAAAAFAAAAAAAATPRPAPRPPPAPTAQSAPGPAPDATSHDQEPNKFNAGPAVLILISVLLLWIMIVWVCKRKKRNWTMPTSKVRSSNDAGEAEKVQDSKVIQAMQTFMDKTFRDRNYKGQFKPQKLQVMEVFRVKNYSAMADLQEYKNELRERRGVCQTLSEQVLSANPPSQLQAASDETMNEYLMFHGTNAAAANAIIETDFRLPKDHKHGAVYGSGIYVAETNTKAHMYCTPDNRGWVPILVVRAILGDIHSTDAESPDTDDLERMVRGGAADSICGDRRNLRYNFSGWREFIVYDNAQVAVEWLVWCKPR